ncbi:hypothetical protein GJAV_G00057650 [Gymnothorax javanicus]|nr:hypothetical protein GJAV_G00057650 [Gymnothorax javanicus]
MVLRLALTGSFLCEVYMFTLCLCGFHLGAVQGLASCPGWVPAFRPESAGMGSSSPATLVDCSWPL